MLENMQKYENHEDGEYYLDVVFELYGEFCTLHHKEWAGLKVLEAVYGGKIYNFELINGKTKESSTFTREDDDFISLVKKEFGMAIPTKEDIEGRK